VLTAYVGVLLSSGIWGKNSVSGTAVTNEFTAHRQNSMKEFQLLSNCSINSCCYLHTCYWQCCKMYFFIYLGFVVPCIFKYSVKTSNQMQQPIVIFVTQSHRCCSTCFRHNCAHHVVGLLVGRQCVLAEPTHTVSPLSNRPRLETRPPPHSYGNWRLWQQFERAPDDGHNNARNMLSGICVTK
jgi:hypothetical protein